MRRRPARPAAHSQHDLPAELHELLAAMCEGRRPIPAAAMEPDEQGFTVLGAWVRRRLDSAVAAGLGQQPGELRCLSGWLWVQSL